MIGSTNWKKWLTFGGAPVPGMNSRSLFHFTHHRGIGNFRISISISDAVTGRVLQTLQNDWCRQYNESDSADIQINQKIQIPIPDHFWLRFWHWRRFALS